MSDLHVGDIGTVLRFTVKEGTSILDVSGASVKTLKLLKKDKTVDYFDLDFYTDGTDGIVEYTTTSGSDIDQKGKITAQVYLEMAGGKWHTSKVDIEVDDNVDT
jgi:hypothetical protein